MDVFRQRDDKYKVHRDKAVAIRLRLEQELVLVGREGVLMTTERLTLLALQPMELLFRLRSGQVSAVAVLQAYQAKAIEVTKRTNCVTEFILEAKEIAVALDTLMSKRNYSSILPLHGLPVSVKDNISVRGMDSTFGLYKNVSRPAMNDADIIKIVKKLGAIPFVKTNVPQLCLTAGCSNPVWGNTLHRLNILRSTGGSSGGEAALIADGGSVVGFGTDIAGSIRIPASWSGVYGLKPTSKRLPRQGVVGLIRPVGIHATAGVLGSDAALVAEVTKALLSADLHHMDVEVPPLPWNDAAYLSKKPLRVGYFDSHEIMPSTPGVKRAVAEAVSLLKGRGHEVLPFEAPDLWEAASIYSHLLFADNGTFTKGSLEEEAVDKDLEWFNVFASLPVAAVQQNEDYLRQNYGDISMDFFSGKLASIADLWKKIAERNNFCSNFLEAWRKDNLDLLVCPVFPAPPPKLQHIAKISPCFPLTFLFNLLDYPAAAVPITFQAPEDETNIVDYQPTDLVHEYLKESGQDAVGMPLGVQIVGLPYCEELLCRAMKEISEAANSKLRI